MSDWYRVAVDGRITLTLHIQPGAKKTEIAGCHGDALKIRLAAPPVDGKANDTLVAWVAAELGLPRRAVRLKRGPASRSKQLEVDLPLAAVQVWLAARLPEA